MEWGLLEKLLQHKPNTYQDRNSSIEEVFKNFEKALKGYFLSTIHSNDRQVVITPLSGKYLDVNNERDLDFFALGIKPLVFINERCSVKNKHRKHDQLLERKNHIHCTFVRFASLNYCLQQSATNYLLKDFYPGESISFPLFMGFKSSKKGDELSIQKGNKRKVVNIKQKCVKELIRMQEEAPGFSPNLSHFWTATNSYYAQTINSDEFKKCKFSLHEILFANVALLSKNTGLHQHHYFPSIQYMGPNDKDYTFGNIVVSSDKILGKERLKLLRIASGLLFSQIGIIEQTYFVKSRFIRNEIDNLKSDPNNFFKLILFIQENPDCKNLLKQFGKDYDNTLKYAVRVISSKYKPEIDQLLSTKKDKLEEEYLYNKDVIDQEIPVYAFTEPFEADPETILKELSSMHFSLNEINIAFHVELNKAVKDGKLGHASALYKQYTDKKEFWSLYSNLSQYEQPLCNYYPEIYKEIYSLFYKGIAKENIDSIQQFAEKFKNQIQYLQIDGVKQIHVKLNTRNQPSFLFWAQDFRKVSSIVQSNYSSYSTLSRKGGKDPQLFTKKGTIIYKMDAIPFDSFHKSRILESLQENIPNTGKLSELRQIVIDRYKGQLMIYNLQDETINSSANEIIIINGQTREVKWDQLSDQQYDTVNELGIGIYYVFQFLQR